MKVRRLPYPVLKSKTEVKRMRAAGRAVGRILHEIRRLVAPGVTTRDLADLAAEMIREAGGVPLFLDYPHPAGPHRPAFPSVICASANEVIVHGIPNRRPLREGDIVSVDCGVRIDGFVGDAAVTIPVGELAPEVDALVRHTREALDVGIEQCQAGNHVGDISHAVQRFAEARGYGVVRDYCGHGVGRQLHEEPQVPNYGEPGTGEELRPGLCLAIEPMINLGTHRTKTLRDHWTVVTEDRRPSAHFEHSIAITKNGPVVLTAYDPAGEAGGG